MYEVEQPAKHLRAEKRASFWSKSTFDENVA